MHPLTTKKSQLTDALNATLRTYNGNELVLQNDMGNTKVQDSVTGNIIGLKDGFIPIGMKEHGGILYIASYNPLTEEGELGTIPSPVIDYTYNSPSITQANIQITNLDDGLDNSLMYFDTKKYLTSSFKVSDTRFQPGDQFIISLSFDGIQQTIKRKIRKSLTTFETVSYPLVTEFKQNSDLKNYGMFDAILEARVEKSDQSIPISIDKKQVYYTEQDLDQQQSKYWFINASDMQNKIVDQDRCQADDVYNYYPNILPGFLYVKFNALLPENFQFFENKTTGVRSPNVYIIND